MWQEFGSPLFPAIVLHERLKVVRILCDFYSMSNLGIFTVFSPKDRFPGPVCEQLESQYRWHAAPRYHYYDFPLCLRDP